MYFRRFQLSVNLKCSKYFPHFEHRNRLIIQVRLDLPTNCISCLQNILTNIPPSANIHPKKYRCSSVSSTPSPCVVHVERHSTQQYILSVKPEDVSSEPYTQWHTSLPPHSGHLTLNICLLRSAPCLLIIIFLKLVYYIADVSPTISSKAGNTHQR
nr:MAG TPA: hypothetical protein [Caudoviricetes sp.]